MRKRDRTKISSQGFFAIFERGPRAFQIWKSRALNTLIGKFAIAHNNVFLSIKNEIRHILLPLN